MLRHNRPRVFLLPAALLLLFTATAFPQATPVTPTISPARQGLLDDHGAAYWGPWPEAADPVEAGTKIIDDLLTRPLPWDRAQGMPYQEDVVGYGALRFAADTGRNDLLTKLVQRYNVLLTERGKMLITDPTHVDESVFGIIPLQIFRLTAADAEKKIALEQVAKLTPATPMKADGGHAVGGLRTRGSAAGYQREAQQQFDTLNLSHQDQITQWLILGKHHADTQWANPRDDGLTDQTRMWVDDMFMIISLQCQAYRATGDKLYLDRAAKEMTAYLDKLQQANGLFFHADSAHFYWGRGNGWFAVGMAELLSDLPATHPQHDRILDGYKKMMAGLLKYQAPTGMWRQLIDHDESWEESSSTGMFTFAIATGVRNHLLDEATYKDPARKAWIALASHLNEQGQVTDVCTGTGAGNSVDYYLARQRITGDLHGQAAFIWAAWAMIHSPASPTEK